MPKASPSHAPLDPNETRALESLAQRDKANASVRVELGNLYMDHGQFDDAEAPKYAMLEHERRHRDDDFRKSATRD